MIAPRLSELIRTYVEAYTMGLHVGMPGRVISYNASRQTVDVQPQIKRVVATEDDPDEPFEYENLASIPDVPIAWPSALGGTLCITMALQAGDPVTLVFMDFDPGQYRVKGEPTTPGDLRAHGLSGAIAHPGGLRADKDKLAASMIHATKIVIGGGVLLGNANAAQSMIKGDDHKTEYDAHTHPTPMGPSGAPAAPMSSLSSKHKLDA